MFSSDETDNCRYPSELKVHQINCFRHRCLYVHCACIYNAMNFTLNVLTYSVHVVHVHSALSQFLFFEWDTVLYELYKVRKAHIIKSS